MTSLLCKNKLLMAMLAMLLIPALSVPAYAGIVEAFYISGTTLKSITITQLPGPGGTLVPGACTTTTLGNITNITALNTVTCESAAAAGPASVCAPAGVCFVAGAAVLAASYQINTQVGQGNPNYIVTNPYSGQSEPQSGTIGLGMSN